MYQVTSQNSWQQLNVKAYKSQIHNIQYMFQTSATQAIARGVFFVHLANAFSMHGILII